MCQKCHGKGSYTTSPFPGIVSFEFCSCEQSMQACPDVEQTLDILKRRIEEYELQQYFR